MSSGKGGSIAVVRTPIGDSTATPCRTSKKRRLGLRTSGQDDRSWTHAVPTGSADRRRVSGRVDPSALRLHIGRLSSAGNDARQKIPTRIRATKSRRSLVGVLGVAVVASLAAGCGGSGSSLRPTTTTVAAETTTSSRGETTPSRVPASPSTPARPSTTTTTAAPATTTTVAPTTTLAPAPTTTTSTASTTTSPRTRTSKTTTPPTASSTTSTTATTLAVAPVPAPTTSSSTPWGWIAAGIGIAAALALVIVLIRRRNRRRARDRWGHEAAIALDAARLAEALMTSEGHTGDPPYWESVRSRVGEAADLLDRSAASAPPPMRQHVAGGRLRPFVGWCLLMNRTAYCATALALPPLSN